MAVLISTKKTKTVDFELCLICQIGSKQTDYKNYVLNPSLASVEKLSLMFDVLMEKQSYRRC